MEDRRAFGRPLRTAGEADWVVYCKPPLGGPAPVLDYLGRYTHRVAISKNRLVRLENGKVTFRWKDYGQGSRFQLMTLGADEFIRRVLLHVLPPGHHAPAALWPPEQPRRKARPVLQTDCPDRAR